MKIIFRNFFYNLIKFLPKSDFGDWLHNIAYFRIAHGRHPSNSNENPLINDYFFNLKNSSEMYDPLRQFTSDKELVKQFIESVLGSGYTPETINVLTCTEALSSYIANCDCVLKPTHSSGGVHFLNKGDKLSSVDVRDITQSLSCNLYESHRERNYRYLKPKIIIEKQVTNPQDIMDYKVFCFKGKPRFIQVDIDRQTAHRRNLYDTSWNKLPITYNFENGADVSKPLLLDKMLEISSSLSSSFESVRVDFFIVGNSIYVGELTHCPESSHGRFRSMEEELSISKIYFH